MAIRALERQIRPSDQSQQKTREHEDTSSGTRKGSLIVDGKSIWRVVGVSLEIAPDIYGPDILYLKLRLEWPSPTSPAVAPEPRAVVRSPPRRISLEEFDHIDIDENCRLDECSIPSVTPSQSSASGAPLYKCELDIVLHPAYAVPCPYLRAWSPSGVQLLTEELQAVIDGGHHVELTASDEPANRYYVFGRLMEEEHPYSGKIVSSFHVCELGNHLQDLFDSIHKQHPGRNGSDGDHYGDHEDVITSPGIDEFAASSDQYMLWFMSITAKHLGLSISPEYFR
jgi:Autophagocytosis associated protein, active-site domain